MKERTNPKSVAPHKVKGTVLFTVVCVMMVLIVFLMGALALAGTASMRASNTYSSTQTQATARAGVNAIIASMQNNVNIAKAAAEVNATNPSADIGEIKFGYMDTKYDEKTSKDKRAETYLNSLGKIEKSGIQYVGKKWEVDKEGRLVEKDVIKVWATATQGTAESTYAAYILKNAGISKGTTGESQGFITTGGAVSANHTSVYGGAYIGFDEYWKGGFDPTKDAEKAKADAAKAAEEWKSRLPMNKPTDIQYHGTDAPILYETDFMINGSFYNDTGTDLNLVVKDKGTGMTVWGDLVLGHALFVKTVNALSEDLASGYKYTEVPYLYVEGDIKFTGGGDEQCIAPAKVDPTKESRLPFHIFCGSIQTQSGQKGKLRLMGDVYCYANKTSKLLKQDGSKLFEWGTSQIEGTDGGNKTVSGSFYTKGSLSIEGSNNNNNDTFTIGGDLYVEHDLDLTNITLKVNGKTTVMGTISGSGKLECSKVFCNNVTCPNVDNKENVTKDGYSYVPGGERVKTEQGYSRVDEKVEWEPGVVHVTHAEWRPNIQVQFPTYVSSGIGGAFVIPGSPNDNPIDSKYILKDPVPSPQGTWVVDEANHKIYCSDNTGYTIDIPEVDLWKRTDGTYATEAEVKTVTPAKYFKGGSEVPRDEAVEVLDGHFVKDSDGSTAKKEDAAGTGIVMFPPELEKDVILGERVPAGKTGDVSAYKIIKTVPDIMNSKSDPYAGATFVCDSSVEKDTLDLDDSKNTGSHSSWSKDADGRIIITDSCTITNQNGTRATNKTIIVQASSDHEIWIKLVDFNVQASSLIVDDTGTDPQAVNFFVEGRTQVAGNETPCNGYKCLDGKILNVEKGFGYFCCVRCARQFSDSSTGAKYQIFTSMDTASLASGYTAMPNSEFEELEKNWEKLTAEQKKTEIDNFCNKKRVCEKAIPYYEAKGLEPFDPPAVKKPIINIFAGDKDSVVKTSNTIPVNDKYTMKVETPCFSVEGTNSITAYVKAPYMQFAVCDQAGVTPKSEIIYNGFPIKNLNPNQIGCYGCMIVKEFACKNNWLMMFAGQAGEGGGNGNVTDALMRNWRILYYDNY